MTLRNSVALALRGVKSGEPDNVVKPNLIAEPARHKGGAHGSCCGQDADSLVQKKVQSGSDTKPKERTKGGSCCCGS